MDPDNWFDPSDDPDASMDAFEAGLRRRVLRKRILTTVLAVGVIGFLFASIFRDEVDDFFREKYEVTDAEAAEALQLADAALADARSRDAAWRAGLATLPDLAAREDLGSCPERLREPGEPGEPGEQYFQTSVLPKASFPFRWFGAGEDPANSAFLSSIEVDAQGIRSQVERKHYDPDPGLRVLADARSLGLNHANQFETVFLQFERKDPHMTDAEGFTPGYVVGWAYLWDHGAGEAICATAVYATNSDTVDVTTHSLGATHMDAGVSYQLWADLDVETWRAIAQSLKWRAGPAIEEPNDG